MIIDVPNAYIMRSNVNLTKSLRVALANALDIQSQNKLEARIEQLKQSVPMSAHINASSSSTLYVMAFKRQSHTRTFSVRKFH